MTLALAERLLPSPVMVESAGQVRTPERLSAQVQWTFTSPVNQPLVFGELTTAPVMVGAVLSMLTTGVFTEALLPAVSVAVAVSVGPAPSPKVWARSWVLTPERPSEAV